MAEKFDPAPYDKHAADPRAAAAADRDVHPRAFDLPLWVPVAIIVAGFVLLGIVLMR